jgi:hypothetical protein
MIDARHWKLRERVRTLQREIAEWDAAAQDWRPVSYFQFVAFDSDGRVVQLDQRGAEGSVFRTTYIYDSDGRLRETQAGAADAHAVSRAVYTYDETGRPLAVTQIGESGIERQTHTTTYDERGHRTTVRDLPPAAADVPIMFSIDGSEIGYGAPGAKTMTTRYDEQGLSREVLIQDAGGATIRRITLTRDREGRVVTEEAQNIAPLTLPHAPGPVPAEDIDQLQALVMRVFGAIRTTYDYDAGGRLIFRTQQMGLLGEERIAYAYDERGNPIEESHESINREMQLDRDGGPTSGGETKRMHEARFSYEYDARGNWTKRIVLARATREAEFEQSNRELRTIDYYES